MSGIEKKRLECRSDNSHAKLPSGKNFTGVQMENLQEGRIARNSFASLLVVCLQLSKNFSQDHQHVILQFDGLVFFTQNTALSTSISHGRKPALNIGDQCLAIKRVFKDKNGL